MQKLEWRLHILLYIINKSFFTLLSITMKWINQWISYTKLPSFNTTTVILHKSIKHQEVMEKKHDFKMPSCGRCCTIMVHFIRVPIKKIIFHFMDPLRFYSFVQNHCNSIKLKTIFKLIQVYVYLFL